MSKRSVASFVGECETCYSHSPWPLRRRPGPRPLTVADTTGAVIPGASIHVRNEKTGAERNVKSSDTGVFFVTNLSPATYTIVATSTGLNDAVYKEVNLALGQERTINIIMQPTSVATEITVSGGELAVVDTSSATVGANVNAREVAQMPINGRQVSPALSPRPRRPNLRRRFVR